MVIFLGVKLPYKKITVYTSVYVVMMKSKMRCDMKLRLHRISDIMTILKDDKKIETHGGNENEIEKSYAGGNRYRQISCVL